MSLSSDPHIVPDSERRTLLARLPGRIRDLVQLARFDRPVGAWLLFWPGAWAVALAGEAIGRFGLILWLALGAAAMRGAGCVYNDIVDRDLDARVARTRARPLASGRVSLRAAWAWVLALCLVGLVVLARLGDRTAQVVALASVPLVLSYPFMKRITWWPQAWLGLVFSWAAAVGWCAARHDWFGAVPLWQVLAPGAWLYAGAVVWVIGYDTIYALQDLEDDALAGVRSSARALGRHVRAGVGTCYAAATGLWGLALWAMRPDPVALLALLPAALHLLWQVATLDPADPANALARFRANRFTGLLVFLACLVVGQTSS